MAPDRWSRPFAGRLSALCALLAWTQALAPAAAQTQASWADGFVENRGQWASRALFVGRSGPLDLAVEPTGLEIRERGRPPTRIVFDGASDGATVVGTSALPGLRNYFLGSEPGRWQSGLSAFSRVEWIGLHEGVDVAVSVSGGGLEFSLRVAPGVDVGPLSFRCEGEGVIALTGLPAFGAERFGAAVAAADGVPGSSLEAGLEWATFLGSGDYDALSSVAVAPDGRILVVGDTESPVFPLGPGGFDVEANGHDDVFVLALDPSGSQLDFVTFLGGGMGDHARDVAVGASGEITVVGSTPHLHPTVGPDFPLTAGAFDVTANGPVNSADAFVTRLDPQGASLVFSTLLGGSALDSTDSIALAADGDAIVAGGTDSTDFPATAGAYRSPALGERNVFITRLDSDGADLEWSALLGGSKHETLTGLELLSDEDVVVCGSAQSPDFPYTAGAYQTVHDSCFVSRIASDGSALEASTTFGGTQFVNNSEQARVVREDRSGNLIVAGFTSATNFPTTPGVFAEDWPGGSTLGFVTCFDAQLHAIRWSTYVGLGFEVRINGLAIDGAGGTIVTGSAKAPMFPTTPGCFDPAGDYAGEVFVCRLSPEATAVWYSTFLGGTGIDSGDVLAPTADGGALVGQVTWTTDYPATPGAHQEVAPGPGNLALAKLTLLPHGTFRYGSPTPGSLGEMSIGVTSMPQPGDTDFALTCGPTLPASARGVLALGAAALATPVGIGGAALWLDPAAPLLLVPVASDAMGGCIVRFTVPAQAALVGLQGFAQFLWRDPGQPTGDVSASRGLTFTIQP